MNKLKVIADQVNSDSELSLQLSDASSLSSESDLKKAKKSKKTKKSKTSKKKKTKKTKEKYCICRKGYDGKEFMIECDGCQEWFHGDCIGLEPKSVTDHYYCDSCTNKKKYTETKKPLIILPPQPKQPANLLPVISKLSIHEDEDVDLDDDICILCDGDCTCGAIEESSKAPPSPPPVITTKTPIVRPSTPPKIQTKIIIPLPKRTGKSIAKGKKLISRIPYHSEEDDDEDEEVIVDDLDDLLETMSPLSNHASTSENSILENQEFFTDESEDEDEEDDSDDDDLDESDNSIDSGDDEDIEDEETKQIIQEFYQDSEEFDTTDESEEEESHDYTFVEDNYDEEEEIPYSYRSYWSSSEDEQEEEEEEIEFEYTTADSDDNQQQNDGSFLPLLDSDNIAAAFIQALATNLDGDTTTGTNTPILNKEQSLSPFELANVLSVLSSEQRSESYLRRPSLPSSALSAARRMRGSQDMNSSENLRALTENSPLSLHPIDEEEDTVKKDKNETADISLISSFQEQILNMIKSSHPTGDDPMSPLNISTPTTPTHNNIISRQILPKPSGSGSSYFPPLSTTALEQHIQEAIHTQSMSKRKAGISNENNEKKRRMSRSNSLNILQQHLQPLEASSFSTPTSPTAIMDDIKFKSDEDEEGGDALDVSIDDLVDTSRLYSKSLSPELEEDDPYSKDLSRWQRIPIGAFRLMRSKNKLWLER